MESSGTNRIIPLAAVAAAVTAMSAAQAAVVGVVAGLGVAAVSGKNYIERQCPALEPCIL